MMQVKKFSELFVGLSSSFEVQVDLEMVRGFIAISGDCNPLHVDETYALKKGFRDTVVHGLLTSAFYSRLVGVHLPGQFSVMHGINIDYLNPVYINDTLTISGSIKYINEVYRQIEIASTITNQQRQKVSKAKIKVGVIDE